MSDQRDDEGRFVRGGPSPNSAGRPRGTSRSITSLADADALTVKVANMRVPLKAGSKVMVPTYERALRSLATGNPVNRLANEAFIEVTRDSLRLIDQRKRRAEILAEQDEKRARGVELPFVYAK